MASPRDGYRPVASLYLGHSYGQPLGVSLHRLDALERRLVWATQIPTDGNFWHDLAGPFFVAGMGTAFAVIPVSIGALAGVTERDAGVASGLLNTSQQLGAPSEWRSRRLSLPRTSGPSSIMATERLLL